MRIEKNILDVESYKRLIKSVGWGCPNDLRVKSAIEGSLFNIVIIENDKIIAIGRLLGDRGISYYIKDIVVEPSYQNKGFGKFILNEIFKYINNDIEEGWTVSIELMSANGKESFYEKLGFNRMPSEKCGCGMIKMFKAQ